MSRRSTTVSLRLLHTHTHTHTFKHMIFHATQYAGFFHATPGESHKMPILRMFKEREQRKFKITLEAEQPPGEKNSPGVALDKPKNVPMLSCGMLNDEYWSHSLLTNQEIVRSIVHLQYLSI